MADALAALRPGAGIDLRGARISQELLASVLSALTPAGEGAVAILGDCRFDEAQFNGQVRFDKAQFKGLASFVDARFNADAWFDEARFAGDARFDWARFAGHAGFDKAHFNEDARFDWARFAGHAGFDKAEFEGIAEFATAQFNGTARFDAASFFGAVGFAEAQFTGDAGFATAQFHGDARFDKAQFADAAFVWTQFNGTAWFDTTQFTGDAKFDTAQFNKDAWFVRTHFKGTAGFNTAQFEGTARFDGARFDDDWVGPLLCGGKLSAQGIAMASAVRLTVEARSLALAGAQFAAPCVFAVRYAAVDLTDVVTAGPISVATHTQPFPRLEESPKGLSGNSRASVVSLAGVDAANVVLTDVDLSECVFSGAKHLDRLQLEGRCLFASAPRGLRVGLGLIPVRRWTRRKVLAEEVAWRSAARAGVARSGWSKRDKARASQVPAASPAQLAVLYRQLRKALEDVRDTPGASDFYFGEMEARRHDRDGTPFAERFLLHLYWLLSGYALRASRALGILVVTAAISFLLLLALGLPDSQANPTITGSIPPSGQQVTLAQSSPDATLSLPLKQRFSPSRVDEAGQVLVNAMTFRATDVTLTGAGNWTDSVSRITEPVLLAFALLAARGRVRR